MPKKLIISIFIMLTGGLAVSLGLAYASPERLQIIASDLEEDFDMIGHITPEELQNMLASNRRVILLDTRKPAEFKVSHIDGAIRISPRASVDDLLAVLPESVEEADIVFYCSVGARSSRVAKRSQVALKARGAAHIYNLRGGLFEWHNQALPLVNEDGPTDLIHPYSKYWGRLLSRRGKASKYKEK